MRYLTVTGYPDNVEDNSFMRRQVHCNPPRWTKQFIVMTMYNEGDTLFARTMHGVMKNIAYLCKRDRSKTWGKDGWKEVVDCIVKDGRLNINSRMPSAIRVHQVSIATNMVNSKPVSVHEYEYNFRVRVAVIERIKIEDAERNHVLVQFYLKEKNEKKINSHRWLFNAFGHILRQNVCVLLDNGIRPDPSSIYSLWNESDIVAFKEKYGRTLLNPLVAAQNFEYKMSSILEKPSTTPVGSVAKLYP
ncbi:chitin synthase [Lactarius akahatsu]|uniref:Chitin synthase n=1 Tax=Lactarius akahatsu TaxID=416441 RepID=A0AAD4L8F1_9AGAM|nr:chitin synthase [Lactarius akahatsu]